MSVWEGVVVTPSDKALTFSVVIIEQNLTKLPWKILSHDLPCR